MTNSNSERCPKCGQMKTASNAGSLTQWINVCGCDTLESLPDSGFESIQFCALCAKRISNERKGSLTQFIFRSDVCKCDHPLVADNADSPEMAARIAEATKIDLGPIKKELTAEEIAELAAKFSLAVEKFPFDRYSPVKVLGEGASGVVYLANDRYLRKQVAIKCLQRLETAQLVSFQNEARATSKLSHECIVTVFDFGATTAGVPYMVMEYIDGISLSHYLEERNILSPLQATRITIKVAQALDRAHYQNVFHRDVKPSNIILGGDLLHPDVKLIDFGVAQLRPDSDSSTIKIDGQSIVGTPAYMAPELTSGGEFSAWAEIYSVGCTLFQCLTGKLPFDSDNALVLIRRHVHEAPHLVSDLNDQVPLQLEQVVSKCLEKIPSDRFQSMSELTECLKEIEETLQEDEASEAAERMVFEAASSVDLFPQSTKSLPANEPQSKKRHLYAGVVLVTLVVVAGIAATNQFMQPKRTAAEAVSSTTTPVKVPDRIKNETNYLDETFDAIDFDGRLLCEGPGTIKKIADFTKQHSSARTVLIRSAELTDKELPILVKLKPSLFSLSKCTSLTDEGLLQFKTLDSVSNLGLDDNPQFSPKGFKNLSVIPHLGELTLKNCDLDTDDIKALSNCKDLFNLDIRDNPKVTLKSLEAFGKRRANLMILIAGCAAIKASPQEKKIFEKNNNITLSSAR